jgi:hypothetical protein
LSFSKLTKATQSAAINKSEFSLTPHSSPVTKERKQEAREKKDAETDWAKETIRNIYGKELVPLKEKEIQYKQSLVNVFKERFPSRDSKADAQRRLSRMKGAIKAHNIKQLGNSYQQYGSAVEEWTFDPETHTTERLILGDRARAEEFYRYFVHGKDAEMEATAKKNIKEYLGSDISENELRLIAAFKEANVNPEDKEALDAVFKGVAESRMNP